MKFLLAVLLTVSLASKHKIKDDVQEFLSFGERLQHLGALSHEERLEYVDENYFNSNIYCSCTELGQVKTLIGYKIPVLNKNDAPIYAEQPEDIGLYYVMKQFLPSPEMLWSLLDTLSSQHSYQLYCAVKFLSRTAKTPEEKECLLTLLESVGSDRSFKYLIFLHRLAAGASFDSWDYALLHRVTLDDDYLSYMTSDEYEGIFEEGMYIFDTRVKPFKRRSPTDTYISLHAQLKDSESFMKSVERIRRYLPVLLANKTVVEHKDHLINLFYDFVMNTHYWADVGKWSPKLIGLAFVDTLPLGPVKTILNDIEEQISFMMNLRLIECDEFRCELWPLVLKFTDAKLDKTCDELFPRLKGLRPNTRMSLFIRIAVSLPRSFKIHTSLTGTFRLPRKKWTCWKNAIQTIPSSTIHIKEEGNVWLKRRGKRIIYLA